MKKRFFIIDGHALCYRGYYAFIKNPLINSKGQNISAVYGFSRMLLKLLFEQKPDYLAIAFDPPQKSFRFQMYSEYKANRQKAPDDLKSQIEEIKNLTTQIGLRHVIEDGFEADDVLGTFAKKFASKDVEVVIVTGDKDAYQLVNDNVSIYANTKGISEYDIYTREKVFEKLGVYPENIIDYMSLTGDTADNVPGIKGVGEKTAQKLIEQYSTLENIFANEGGIKGKLKDLISSGHESALLSRDLVTIRTDIPVEFTLDDFAFSGVDADAASAYFKQMEMNSIVAEYFTSSKPELKKDDVSKNYVTVKTLADISSVVERIKKAGLVSIDTETTSVKPTDAEIVGLSFSVEPFNGWYVPATQGGLFSDDGVMFSIAEALDAFREILEDESILKVGQNIKYDVIVYRMNGIDVKGVVFDTMIASYVLEGDRRRHNMDDMAQYYLDYKTITYDELTGTGKNRRELRDVALEELTEYAAEDADVTLRLYNELNGRLSDKKLRDLFERVEMPLVEVLTSMELTGVKIDAKYFASFGNEINSMLSACENRIYGHAGDRFNINSTKELSSVLFEKLNLRVIKKTKTGFSTDISVLEALHDSHPIIRDLIEYRSLAKLKSTYVDALPALINARTGRIHTNYNQAIVATGRLSSSEPNLQNIPARDDFGKKIRKGFIAEKGFEIFSADYSQIELRLAAHLSGDENMIRAFLENVDIHSLTASSVFSVAIGDVTAAMRRQAKIINFATIYGVSPFGLSQQADISPSEAKMFIEKYFETYPGFRNYMERMISFAKEHGYVETMLGRRRYISEINDKVSFRREGAERVAINTPIQGTSADMIKIAMNDIYREFKSRKMKSRMIMQVHDELVVETALDEKKEVERIVKSRMENAVKLDVPVVVDCAFGESWGDAH